MRFIIAAILLSLYVLVLLLTSKMEGISLFVGYFIGAAVVGPSLVAAMFCIPRSKRNNKRFFRAFNFVLLIAIAVNIGDVAQVLLDSEKPSETFSSADGLVELTTPGGVWTRKVDVEKDNVLLSLEGRGGYVVAFVAVEFTDTSNFDLNEYAQLVGDKFKERPDFVSGTEIEECGVTISLDCVLQRLNTSAGEKGTITTMASLKGQEGFYNFVATTNPGLYDQYKNDIYDLLKSIKVRRI